MNAYSLDLRKKIVEAKERGMPTSEVARAFGVGVSTVKRYAATARQGRPLAPKKHPGSKPKIDEGARRLLEADLEERPAATLPERREFLRRTCGGFGERLHGLADAQAPGMDSKKDRWMRMRGTSS
jgi:transposase